MSVFSRMKGMSHEQVLFFRDPALGWRAIVAIHSTVLGPALGGCRMWHYVSEEEALVDVLRLSQGMTYKASLAGLDLGGGKSVILAEPGAEKDEALFRWFGQRVESLGGRYITAEDVGTTVADLKIVARQTRHAVGLPLEDGGSGDPSPLTAWGVFCGIRACLQERFGDDAIRGRRVAIQGVGKVGLPLARLLAEAGADLVVSDRDGTRARQAQEELRARTCSEEAIFDVDCDVFAPCALGGILNDRTIERLRCKVIAGAANNQLLEPRHGERLAQRGILYAPDYCINAGGLINVDLERSPPYDPEVARAKVARVYHTLLVVFERARREKVHPYEAAARLSEERIARGSRAGGEDGEGGEDAPAESRGHSLTADR